MISDANLKVIHSLLIIVEIFPSLSPVVNSSMFPGFLNLFSPRIPLIGKFF